MISFMHFGNESMASYRYRCKMPSEWLGADINNPTADVHIYAKPTPQDVEHAKKAKAEGKTVIVDFCDLHFERKHYREMLYVADFVTCSSEWAASYLHEDFGINAYCIPEPYELPEKPPHCFGSRLLWFGSAGNYDSLERVRPSLEGFPLTVVSNVAGGVPWSIDNLERSLRDADIVILPETAPYKSANRAVEAIRSGCFVVAEPHPSLEGFPVYTGNLRKGIEWASQNPNEANDMTLKAQEFVRNKFSPKTLGHAWKTAIEMAQSCSTLGRVVITGTDG